MTWEGEGRGEKNPAMTGPGQMEERRSDNHPDTKKGVRTLKERHLLQERCSSTGNARSRPLKKGTEQKKGRPGFGRASLKHVSASEYPSSALSGETGEGEKKNTVRTMDGGGVWGDSLL